MKKTRFGLVSITTFIAVLMSAGAVHAVVTTFNDIALDGEGSTPFIRFEHNGVGDRFLVAFGDSIQFWDGSSYSFKVYETATSSDLVLRDGNVGVNTQNPTETLHVDGNALISGNLELGSSRTIKSDITALSTDEAIATIAKLEPVTFKYLHSQDELSVGFIAEDVPDLVATKSRKSLSSMDMVAVLTKVVQQQQHSIAQLSDRVSELCNERGC